MNKLTCAVVQDLLPLYEEGLTSPETTSAVQEHLDMCHECAEIDSTNRKKVEILIEKPDKMDRKIMTGMRLKMFWYMLWPLLYGLSWQFNWQEAFLRISIILMVFLVGAQFYSIMEIGVDPNSRKQYYERENRRLEQGRGYTFMQVIYIILPMLIPVLLSMLF